MAAKPVVKLLAMLEQFYPNLKASAVMAEAWTVLLGRYSEEQLEAAAVYAIERSPDFAPPAPAIKAAIEGRIVRIPILATDNFGNVKTPHVVVGHQEVRVKPGVTAPAHVAEGAALPSGVKPVEPEPSLPMLPEVKA